MDKCCFFYVTSQNLKNCIFTSLFAHTENFISWVTQRNQKMKSSFKPSSKTSLTQYQKENSMASSLEAAKARILANNVCLKSDSHLSKKFVLFAS